MYIYFFFRLLVLKTWAPRVGATACRLARMLRKCSSPRCLVMSLTCAPWGPSLPSPTASVPALGNSGGPTALTSLTRLAPILPLITGLARSSGFSPRQTRQVNIYFIFIFLRDFIFKRQVIFFF